MEPSVDTVRRTFVAELNFADGQHCYESGQTLGLLPLPRNVWEVNVQLEINIMAVAGDDHHCDWKVLGMEYLVCNYKPELDYNMVPEYDWKEITNAMQAEIDLFCAEAV